MREKGDVVTGVVWMVVVVRRLEAYVHNGIKYQTEI